MPNKEFGKYLRAARVSKNLTLSQIGKEVGLSHSYLSQIETGLKKAPSPEILKKLAEAIGVPYLEMMEKAGYLVDVYVEKRKSALLEVNLRASRNLETIKKELLVDRTFNHEVKDYLSERISRYRLTITPDNFLATMENMIEDFSKRIAEDIDNGDGFYSENENYFKTLDSLMIFTEEGRKQLTETIEKAKDKKDELLLILQREGLTYNGYLLSQEDRQHILDMLAWSFRNKTK